MKWSDLGSVRGQVYQELKKRITEANYGDHKKDENRWSLTELIQSTNQRKYTALEVLEGRQLDGKVFPDMAVDIKFKLRVLSRQAVYKDKNGQRVFLNPAGRDNVGDPDDIIVLQPDTPVEPGDVIRVKGRPKREDEEGQPLDIHSRNRMSMYGEDMYIFHEFVVDKDGCIEVGYPHAYIMLQKNGKRLAFPQFEKGQRPRRVTAWLYEEVFETDAKPKRSRKKRAENTKGMSNEQSIETGDTHNVSGA